MRNNKVKDVKCLVVIAKFLCGFVQRGLCIPCRPVVHLPVPKKATLAVRCCPVYFQLRQGSAATTGMSLLR